MMDLRRLPDDARRRLSVTVVVVLMAAAAISAGVLGAFGRESGADTALAVALAASFPVLAGTVRVSPSTTQRSLKIALAAVALVALLSLALSQPLASGA